MTRDTDDTRKVPSTVRQVTIASWTVALAIVSVDARLGATDWPQFRGPGGQGVSLGQTELPTSWSETQNLAWKVGLPGFGASSPIVHGNRVYVTCYSGYGVSDEPSSLENLRLHVVAVNLNDGEIHWVRTFEPQLPETERVREHGYAASTPTIDGERLYVFFGKTGVMALDLDGKPVWQTSVGTDLNGWGSGASPILFGDLLIVNASVESGGLVALDKRTGRQVWRAEGIDNSWSSPHLVDLPDGRVELVMNVEGQVVGFDPATGERLWWCDGIRSYTCPTAVSKDGIVYVTGGRQSRILAVRAGGRGNVTDTHKLWETQAGANVCSPVIHGDYLYWLSDRNQVAYCVNRHSGEVVYSERMRGEAYASAVLAGDKLYIVTRNDGTLVLAAQPEFQLLAHNRFEDRSTFNGSPAVAGDSLLIRSDRFLYRIRQ
jgi:outer membrane protein assembly factor BamB